MDFSVLPKNEKPKIKTTTYKMKDVFDKMTVPKNKKNKVIAKVKKTIS